jgi:adenine deaminase
MFLHNDDNRRLLETALGNQPADLVIKDGTLMDVYTGRILPHRSVAITGKWIAYVGPDADHTIGERTRVIEAGERILAPGYIDSHTHLANYCDMADVLEYAIPGGTTTFVTEVESYGFALGAEGVRAFLDQVRHRPVKILCLVPPLVGLSPAAEPLFIAGEALEDLLDDERVLGLGESYWQSAILTSNDRVLSLMRETLKAGKSVQGHAAGASGKKLAAYGAAGALSCHEAVSPEDVLARLELGFYAMIREGNVRRDLESLRPLIGTVDFRRCTLCTDGVDTDILLTRGYLIDVVQKAVDMGFTPLEAVRMVTLNPAEHLGLSHLVGGIAPGRFGDVLLLPEPNVMKPDLVISEGQIVAEKGKTLVSLPRIPHPESLSKTVRIRPVKPEDFSVPRESCSSGESVRTIDIQSNGLVTREGRAEISQEGRAVSADTSRDLLKLVFIERASGRGQKFVGFVRGWGQKEGAVASSMAWDASAVVAIGASDLDLAAAVNRVIQDQGGTTLAVKGAVRLHIPFSIGGYVSQMKIEALDRELSRFKEMVSDLGVNLDSPLLTLVTLTTAAIPFIRITEKGYFRFRENDYVGL